MLAGTFTCLLGPQRFEPNIASILAEQNVHGSIAVVTAGWQEREDEDLELRDHLSHHMVNLGLYHRAETVFREDPELFGFLRARQNRLRRLQELHRVRLEYVLGCARDLMSRSGEPDLLDPEREDAIEAVRALDQHHLARLQEVHREFEERHRPSERHTVAKQRDELADLLNDVEILAIAGGHVAVLLNRLRLFDLFGLRPDLPVVAWSAGAMVLAEKVVLFHDSPPQGAGNAEVLDAGLGRCTGIVPLPHASQRLRLNDPVRVSIMARRFRPDLCITLDPGTGYFADDDAPARTLHGTMRLFEDGTVRQEDMQ
jgi:hypothetical protein